MKKDDLNGKDVEIFEMRMSGLYYNIISEKIDKMLEVTEGEFPPKFYRMMKDEFMKDLIIKMFEICDTKIEVCRKLGIQKMILDRYLRRVGLYDYYSPKSDKYMKDV